MMQYKNRLICFLDVLGFSKMVESQGIEDIYKKYAKFIDKAKNEVFYSKPSAIDSPDTNFEVSEIVSDSVVLISHEIDNVVCVTNFIGAIQFFLELGVYEGFVFRGGVTLGDVIFDHDRNIVLSKEFNELTKFETSVDMPGCVIRESARQIILDSMFGEKTRQDGLKPIRSLPLIKFNVPLKSKIEKVGDVLIEKERSEFCWVINFTYFLSDLIVNKLVDGLCGDKNKQNNFIDYLKIIQALPDDESNIIELDRRIYDIKAMKTRSGARVAYRNRFVGRIFIPLDWDYPKLFSSPPKLTVSKDEKGSHINIHAVGRWYD